MKARETKGIAKQIKSIRNARGLTQEQLGRKAGGDGRWVRRLEGAKGNPQLSTLGRIAKALGCKLIVCLIPQKPVKKT